MKNRAQKYQDKAISELRDKIAPASTVYLFDRGVSGYGKRYAEACIADGGKVKNISAVVALALGLNYRTGTGLVMDAVEDIPSIIQGGLIEMIGIETAIQWL